MELCWGKLARQSEVLALKLLDLPNHHIFRHWNRIILWLTKHFVGVWQVAVVKEPPGHCGNGTE